VGNIGDTIVIYADEFKIKTMKVVILTAAGVVLEQGNAVLRSSIEDEFELGWVYKITTQNDALAGTKITVTVTDRPGREAVKEVVIA
jgi:lipopolysaccharide export system protein LptA